MWQKHSQYFGVEGGNVLSFLFQFFAITEVMHVRNLAISDIKLCYNDMNKFCEWTTHISKNT